MKVGFLQEKIAHAWLWWTFDYSLWKIWEMEKWMKCRCRSRYGIDWCVMCVLLSDCTVQLIRETYRFFNFQSHTSCFLSQTHWRRRGINVYKLRYDCHKPPSEFLDNLFSAWNNEILQIIFSVVPRTRTLEHCSHQRKWVHVTLQFGWQLLKWIEKLLGNMILNLSLKSYS